MSVQPLGPPMIWPLIWGLSFDGFFFFSCRTGLRCFFGLSLVAVSRGYSSLRCLGFSCCGAQVLGVLALVIAAHRLSSCGSWALEPWIQKLWCTSLFAPWHMESSQTRDRTHIPCIGRQILIHCATREVLMDFERD